jgi:hypothetical protein
VLVKELQALGIYVKMGAKEGGEAALSDTFREVESNGNGSEE